MKLRLFIGSIYIVILERELSRHLWLIHTCKNMRARSERGTDICSFSQNWWWSRSNSRNLLTHSKLSGLSLEKSKKSSSALLSNDGWDSFSDESSSPSEVAVATVVLRSFISIAVSALLSASWGAFSTLELPCLAARFGFCFGSIFLHKWEFQ